MHFGKVLINPDHVVNELGLKKGMTVADLGCGRTGHLLFALSKAVGDEGKVYAVDVVQDHLKMVDGLCRMHGVCNIDGLWGDYEKLHGLALENASLDAAVLVNNLALLQNHHAAVQEIRRILKPDGRFVIVDWKSHVPHPAAPPKERLHSLHDAELLFTRLGMRKIDEIPVSQTHWGLVLA